MGSLQSFINDAAARTVDFSSRIVAEEGKFRSVRWQQQTEEKMTVFGQEESALHYDNAEVYKCVVSLAKYNELV